ncbi:hypothetical protein [Burkholderia metallica]|uniref:hypothetical protein n=1 Tax=Burkholderia metallica TaxID=488729 RepID=UPI000D19C87E|nr:hypothetical protein [Burkholderia metallica]
MIDDLIVVSLFERWNVGVQYIRTLNDARVMHDKLAGVCWIESGGDPEFIVTHWPRFARLMQ